MKTIGNAYRRLRHRLSRLPRPTRSGLICLGISVVLFLLSDMGRQTGLLLLSFLLLWLLALSAILPLRNLRGVTVDRVLPPNVYAGERFHATARIGIEGRRSDAFALVLEDGKDGPYERPGSAIALRVGPKDPARVRYEVRIRDRGRRAVESVRISTRFPFGLFEHRVDLAVRSEILVFPRLGLFRADPLPRTRFSRLMTSPDTVREKGQEEFANLREYRPGDNPRLIAWKATARHGELIVKELENDLAKRVMVFLESRLEVGARNVARLRLERAISFTASLLKLLARRRTFIQLHYLGPGPLTVEAGRGARHLDRIMERLALLSPSATEGVDDLVSRVGPEAFMTSLPVIVVPHLDETRLRNALAAIPPGRSPVVFSVDGAWERSAFGYHADPFAQIRD